MTSPAGVDLVTVTAIDPPGPTVFCRHGDGLSKWQGSNKDGGWQITPRPKRTSMTEWVGFDPYVIVVPIMFGNGMDTGINVDPVVETLRGIMRNPVGPRNEPAVVRVQCPLIPLNWFKFVINGLVETDSLRNAGGGHYFATYDLTLWQWEPTDLTVAQPRTVAQQIAAAPTVPAFPSVTGAAPPPFSNTPVSGWTYTVKAGDTLARIAAVQLGNASRWKDIASLNNIRDPASIKAGQVLRMPGSSAPGSSPANPYPAAQPVGTATGGAPGYGLRQT